MIALSDFTQAFKLASQADKEEFVNAIMPTIEKSPVFEKKVNEIVEAVLDESFEMRLLRSDSHPVQRVFELETITGLNTFNSSDEESDDEEKDQTVLSRLEALETKFSTGNFKPSESSIIDKTPETKTELRASCLVKALEASEKKYFSASEIIDFLKCKLPDSCKIDENVKNIRKVKQDVVSKAVEMFSSIVEPNRKTTGHKDIRLVLKS